MNDLQDIIEDYAQNVVDDMDIDELMASVKQSIIERLEAEEEASVIAEIKNSVYAEEMYGKFLEILEDYVPVE